MTEKVIIVEFGARRQRFTLTDRFISTSKLLQLVSNYFGIRLDHNSMYILQMYNKNFNGYYSLNDDDRNTFDLIKDIEQLNRFRIINKSELLQKCLAFNDVHLTMNRLHSATKDLDRLQHMIVTLNQNCDILNRLMHSHNLQSSISLSSSSVSSYLLDPSSIEKTNESTEEAVAHDLNDEDFESISCYDSPTVPTVPSPSDKPTMIHTTRPKSLKFNNKKHSNIQTRIIPCKYAVRGTCPLGDKCRFSHDETCIQWAREWERRL